MAGVGQRLELRQGQSLVMTPQLQQAIKLLQLSNIELAEYCESELEKNPLLERDDREAGPAQEAADRTPEIIGEQKHDVRTVGVSGKGGGGDYKREQHGFHGRAETMILHRPLPGLCREYVVHALASMPLSNPGDLVLCW